MKPLQNESIETFLKEGKVVKEKVDIDVPKLEKRYKKGNSRKVIQER